MKLFESNDRISFSLYFEKSFFGLGFGSERFSSCNNDMTEKYIVYSIKIYFGLFIFNVSICGKPKPFHTKINMITSDQINYVLKRKKEIV